MNWFRKDADGRFLWPGYGDNARVLAWIFDRCEGTLDATDTPIGFVPLAGDLNVDGLEIDPSRPRRTDSSVKLPLGGPRYLSSKSILPNLAIDSPTNFAISSRLWIIGSGNHDFGAKVEAPACRPPLTAFEASLPVSIIADRQS